ncbi:MAG: ATP-dependent helicase [Fuerstiella sp.]|nr:ATP-dependent helicase [Fuerstiella sp.]
MWQFEQYETLERVGRRVPLRKTQRQAIWDLFQKYEQARRDAHISDWSDVLIATLQELKRSPLERRYNTVIVDEIQDLTVVGLRILSQIVTPEPMDLLIVGDGQQQVYPGSFRLSEAEVNVQGRSVVLKRNYRNGSEILKYALSLMEGTEFSDLEHDVETGLREVESERPGGLVAEFSAHDNDELEAGFLAALRGLIQREVSYGNIAVLCRTNAEIRRWHEFLDNHKIPVSKLTDDSRQWPNTIRVGTRDRAKGLEFQAVLLPDGRDILSVGHGEADPHAQEEREELEARRLFVACTRARDYLWVGGMDASAS